MRTVFLHLSIFLILQLFSYPLTADEKKRAAVSTPIEFHFGHQYELDSEILKEQRKIQVYLPEAYEDKQRSFPVIFILEGDKHYKHATVSIEKIQSSGWIPASIIVGIPNNANTSLRDYTQQGDRFLRYLKEEVQPFVDGHFRTNGYTTVFGHQYSGAFLLKTFIKDPSQFDNYIVANPYIRQDTIDRFDALLNTNPKLEQPLFFSMGTVLDNGPYNVEPVEKLAALFDKKAPKSWQWHYQYYPLHGTFGSANITLYDGLSVTFKDYQGPFIYSYQDYVEGNKMDGVTAYFKKRAQTYHISDKVTVGSLMGLGFMLMDTGYPQEAISMLKDTIEHKYPQSIQLHRVLGRAYEKMENHKQALDAYEKMVVLAKQQNSPRLDYFQSQITRIKSIME